jgi:hypothetical protein
LGKRGAQQLGVHGGRDGAVGGRSSTSRASAGLLHSAAGQPIRCPIQHARSICKRLRKSIAVKDHVGSSWVSGPVQGLRRSTG